MPLEDVSDDQTMISWLRQSGHAHLLDEQLRNANRASTSSPPPSQNIPFGPTTSSNFSPIPPLNQLPQTTSHSPPSPLFTSGGFNSADPFMNSLHRSGSFSPTHFPPNPIYGGASAPLSPTIIPPTQNFTAPPFDFQSSPPYFHSSPTHFLGPNVNQQQLDADIENMKHDPNTRIVQRPPQDDVVYKQRVFVRYLQPPTPPVGGTIIVREKQPPLPPPDPPIVIKRAPPPPPTPPPVIIRERPPPMPPPEGTTVIDKLIPPGPKPPRQVVIEQYPPLPPKPQDVIIERWLPAAPRQRRILYERLPPSVQPAVRPIIVQYGPPHVRVQREIIAAPGAQLPYQRATGHTDINQIVNQLGGGQQLHSSLPLSSLGSYNPLSTLRPNYSPFGPSQPNIIIVQGGQPTTLTPSSYGTPLTCVCKPNQVAGLGAYGTGLSAIPTIGQTAGQSIVYNVSDNVPLDNIFRQLGIDPHSIQPSQSGGFPQINSHNAISHVWDAAAHANPQHISPGPAISHVWNAATHANPQHMSPGSAISHVWDAATHANPQHISPGPAISHVWNAAAHANPAYAPPPGASVSHVWNAAAHATDHSPGSATGHVWDRIENYLHQQPGTAAVQSAWNHIPHPNAPPNYPPPNSPPMSYPPPNSPPMSYPPPNSPPMNYPPPNSPPMNYPPPPPPPPSNYPPPPGGGGGASAGASVLSRLFGGGS